VDVCDNCGFIASSSKECKKCGNEKISKVNMPYAAKLLFQELNAMGIKTIIEAKE
jgi:DNA-directed RNA polymerase III subunit RPC2